MYYLFAIAIALAVGLIGGAIIGTFQKRRIPKPNER